MSEVSVDAPKPLALEAGEYVDTYANGEAVVMLRSYPSEDGDIYVGRVEVDETTNEQYLGCLACGAEIDRTEAGECQPCRRFAAADMEIAP